MLTAVHITLRMLTWRSCVLALLTGACRLVVASASASASGSQQLQQPFVAEPSIPVVQKLADVRPSDFTVLTHSAHPAHRVRVRKLENFCDTTVKAYSGYIDVTAARHIFFYFYESRRSPENDPVVMWTNGGPGCSSTMGMLMELGPCNMNTDGNSTSFNPYSWNEVSNIFFIDQPIGVGYSYAEYGETVASTEEAAKDIAAFLSIFFETFTEFKSREFHMSGESYAGRYIPIYAAELYDQNQLAISEGRTPVNLTSVMIGSGATNWVKQMPSWYDMQCTGASIPPFQPVSTCVRMKQAIPRCEAWTQKSCVDTYDAMNCDAAVKFCWSELTDPYIAAKRNFYDVSVVCKNKDKEYEEDGTCYPLSRKIEEYLNKKHIREIIGADPAVANFTSCNFDLNIRFLANGDMWHQTQLYVANLLERGIKVLIYAGDYDMIANWVGNERWTREMEWSGQAAFAKESLTGWYVNGTEAGVVRSANGLTFATIHGAGHLAPYDRPVESLAMTSRWLEGGKL